MKELEFKNTYITSSTGEVTLLAFFKNYALIRRTSSCQPFVVIWKPSIYQGGLTWEQGHYFQFCPDAENCFKEKIKDE